MPRVEEIDHQALHTPGRAEARKPAPPRLRQRILVPFLILGVIIVGGIILLLWWRLDLMFENQQNLLGDTLMHQVHQEFSTHLHEVEAEIIAVGEANELAAQSFLAQKVIRSFLRKGQAEPLAELLHQHVSMQELDFATVYDTDNYIVASGLYETKESELGFRMISSCAIVCHAYRNIIHGFRYRSKAA